MSAAALPTARDILSPDVADRVIAAILLRYSQVPEALALLTRLSADFRLARPGDERRVIRTGIERCLEVVCG